jgi:hypothetical protein
MMKKRRGGKIMKIISNSRFLMITLILSLLFVLFFAQAAFAQDIRLSASEETGAVGDTVTVKVSIANALDTEGGQFDLSYGPTLAGGTLMLEPVSISGGDFVPSFSSDNYNLNVGGNKLRVLWVTAAGSSKDSGVVCNIVFRITGGGETQLNFSDVLIVDPRDGRLVATPTPGKVTALSTTDKDQAVRLAEDAIDALPATITCADKERVEEARFLVSRAKTQHGAVDSDFRNLSKLLDAERVIAKCDAIKAADDAIFALPEVDKLTLDDKSKVEEARRLVNVAKTQHGAVDSDFLYLTKLVAAENRIKELEGQKPTPPTGGAYFLLLGGVLILITGIAVTFRARNLFADK